MAEYVEKVAFREHLDSVPPFTKYGQRDPKYDFAKTVFLSELAAYPAADVAPVRHGRWADPEEDMCLCTSCGWGFLLPYKTRAADAELVHGFSYCPNCGAKMDKEEKNGDIQGIGG